VVKKNLKVLIIGAGPTGLTAALELARKGVKPEIVDAKKRPSPLSRAPGILPKSIKNLKASGAGDKIFKAALKFNKVRIHYGKKNIIDLDFSKNFPSKDLPVILPQDKTESIMAGVLREKGVRVKYNTKVIDIKTSSQEATATFANGKSKKYDWIIGSDGVNSITRKKLGIKYVGYNLREVWSIADVDLLGKNNPDRFSAWIIDGVKKDIFVMVWLGPNRARLVSSTPDSLKAMPIKLNIKTVRRAASFKIPIKQAETYVKGRVLLAGDAAHSHSPVGGRGMNLGIDDAVAAVQAILKGEVDQYNRERIKIGAKIIQDTEIIRKSLVSKNPFIVASIKLIFFLISNFDIFQRWLIKKITKL
jgi:2-polyprenyl-6-methoxyphenol hydroxylase-like FAD-dependent oxidoreductase